jgi:hypothetical protein
MPTVGAEPKDRSIGALLSNLGADIALLVRQEFELLKAEIQAKLSSEARAGVMLAAGGVVLFSGWLVLLAAAVLGLSTALAPWLSALIIGVVVVLLGAAFVLLGIRRIRETDLTPHRTLRSLREDAAWIKEQMR